jgi:hypothetical protein
MQTDHNKHYAAKYHAKTQPMPVAPHVQALHSYRAHLVPAGVNLSDVEDMADAKLLPTIRVKAANATQAEAYAHLASGKGVLRVERVEG